MKFLYLLFIFTSASLHANTYQGIGVESVSKEDLAKYSPTQPNPKIMNEVQKNLDIRTPGMGYITEDGKTMYMSWSVTGTTQVWQLNAPMSFPVQLTGGEDRTYIEDVTKDGTKFFSRDVGGEENPGIYMMKAGSGELVELLKKSKVQTDFTYLGKDDSYFLYSANDQDPAVYTHYRYDLKTNKSIEFFNEKGIWRLSDVWKNEDYVIMSKITSNTSAEHYRYHLATKKMEPVIGQNELLDCEIRFGTKPDEYIVLTNKLSDFKRLYHFKQGKLNPIEKALNYDVENFSVDFNRTRLIYTIDEDGYSRTYALSLNNFQSIKLPTFPASAEHVLFGRTTRNGRFTTFGVNLYNEPRQSFVYDWKTEKLSRWTKASVPEISTESFTKAKLDYYTAKDGTRIPYFVRIPKQCENKACPVIVDFHGGPEGKSFPGFSPRLEIFLNHGFIYAEPNVRGSAGYGKKWLDIDNGAKRLQVISDIEDAGIELKKKYKASKIGVTGGSYGGYSTLYAMTRFAGTYDAGVAMVGMSNLMTFLMNTAPYRRPLRITEYGDPEKDAEALKELSPITHLQNLKSPLMIIQGVNDPRVPAGEAIQFKKFADNKNIPVELILFADEGHGTAKRSNQAIEISKSLEFFKKYLK